MNSHSEILYDTDDDWGFFCYIQSPETMSLLRKLIVSGP